MDSRIIETLSNQTDIHQYAIHFMAPQPSRDFCELRFDLNFLILFLNRIFYILFMFEKKVLERGQLFESKVFICNLFSVNRA